jgi:hypothetical protein
LYHQNLDECRFSGPSAANQRMNLTAPEIKIRTIQRE